jgi:class 3 adenylate cyclase/streptogramin lyase
LGALGTGSNSFTTYTTAQGLANNAVWSIAEDKTGNLWFGTFSGGVSRYDGKSFTTFTTAQGLANNNIRSIAEDNTGNLWFGTDGSGVSCYDGNCEAVKNTSKKDKNVSKYFTTYTTAQGLANNAVWIIVKDKTGNLWFGTDGGVSRYNSSAAAGTGSGAFTTYTTAQGLGSNVVVSIAEDKTGNLWFGTDGGGVSRYDGKSFTTYTTAQGLANNVVTSIAEDKTTPQKSGIWFGTNEGFNLLVGYKRIKLPAKNDTINSSPILPADNSLSNVELAKNYTPVFEKYNFRNGYPVKDVNTNALRIDSKGIIWAGTGDKLVRFDYNGIQKNMKPPGVFINLIKIEGELICWNLLNKESKVNAKHFRIEDSLAIVNEEVSTFGDLLTAEKRDVMCERYSDVQFGSITPFYPIPVDLVLPYRHNNVTFEFGAVEVDRPNLVNYQYQLQGYDKDWDPVTNKTSATFGNIHEGTYSFKIKAQSPEGVWSEPVTYNFTVLPPLYRSWWAYCTYLLAFISSLILLFRWRTASLRKEKEQLEDIVIERTAQVVSEKKEVEKQKQRSDELLLNILPEEAADELKAKGSADAKLIDEVTVLFTDFKGFTQLSEKLSPTALVAEINECFSAFDLIMDKYGVEKIKTIGDSYMAAGGLPTPNKTHPYDVVKAALDIQQYMHEHKVRKEAAGELFFEIRIGIHTGPVVAGIVGVKKFAYDIWGDTVNTGSRMESSGEVGKINISEVTYELVKDKFTCTYRGEIDAKHKGKLKMYFVG